MRKQLRRVHIRDDAECIIKELTTAIGDAATQCIDAKGYFRCVLAGGETPRRLYSRLRALDTDWSRWHIYFGDERCLPVGDASRNDRMAADSWLDHVAIPADQIHSIRAELGADQGARDYSSTLQRAGRFDLVLLGLGEDGHTASLFPYMQKALGDDLETTAVHAAPKPPPQRVSISAPRLANADRVWFLVCGEGKRAALASWLADAELPAAVIVPTNGVDIFTDIQH